MAVNYLTGDESPTAAKMNELYSEADQIIDKALNGCSTYLLENIGASGTPSAYPDSRLYRGKEFLFWQGATHTSGSNSVLYSAFETIPTTYDQTAYDTAADNATISTYSTDGYAHVAGSSTPNLNRSLKAHTRTNSGQEYYIWEYTEPSPEKKWKLAVAEIIIGMDSGTSFSFPDSYNKYSCWRIHNLTNRDYTIYCGSFSDPHTTFSLPKYSQKCVRRVGTTFHHDYKYFFKCLTNDPRYLFFDSFEGSIAQTMRANNITNPSYIYNLFEFVGMDLNPLTLTNSTGDGKTRKHQRIYFNPTVKNDISSEMETDGHFPSITDSTKIVDLVYTKGKIGYRKKDTSSSTLEVGEIDFDGWSSFNTKLNTINANLAASAISNNKDIKIAASQTMNKLEIWPVSTNVLQINDVNGVLNLASTQYYLQTHFLLPTSHGNEPRLFNRYYFQLDDISTISGNSPANPSTEAYNGTTYTVGNLKSYLTGGGSSDYQTNSYPQNKSVAITSEGPFLYWTDKFDIESGAAHLIGTEGWFDGFTINHGMRVEEVSTELKLLIDQEWFIPLRLFNANYTGGSPKGVNSYLHGYASGWPSIWKDSFFNAISSDARHHIDTHLYHRLFEGPRKTRVYETSTPITAGTETFKHTDINNDPVGADGADFILNDIGTLTTTDIAILTNDIDLKVSKGSFAGGEVNNPNYPRVIIDDKIKEAQDSKNDSSINAIKTLSDYNRLNLLKDHFNNILVHLKKADKIRPLSIDEIYFGNRKMKPHQGWFNSDFAPMDLYEGFELNDAQYDLYVDLFGNTNNIYSYDDFPSGTAILNAANDTGSGATEKDRLENFRWVKINDVKSLADSLGLGFRFEELSSPANWTPTLTITSAYTGGSVTHTNIFVNAISGTSLFKIKAKNGIICGSDYATYTAVPLFSSGDTSGTLSTAIYANTNTSSYINLNSVYKSNMVFQFGFSDSASSDNFPISLVYQNVDSTRTNNSPRATLAVKPLKRSVTVNNEDDFDNDTYSEDVAPTASSQLVNLTSSSMTNNIEYFYPNDSRHRYAFILSVSAPSTHSA